MATVMEEEVIAGLGGGDEVAEGPADVGAGGLSVGSVGVDEDGDVSVVEAELLHQGAVHPVDVVDAALEFGLGARVVATHQHRSLSRHESLPLFASLRRCRWWSCASAAAFCGNGYMSGERDRLA